MSAALEFNFIGRRAVVLHPAETVRADLSGRLGALGVTAEGQWPDLSAKGADFLFVDVDMGHDAQIPWERGTAPMPMIGLIRSESPGRLSWALGQRFDAFLPQAALGSVYSTMVVASAKCAERRAATRREAELARRAGLRLDLVRAILLIMRRDGVDERVALKRLRALAMVEHVPLEDAATRLLSDAGGARMGSAG